MKNVKVSKKHQCPYFEELKEIEKCNISHSRSLKIGWNLTLKVFPEEIKKLTWLTSLTVKCTEINKLPDWIGELVNLKKLDISSNSKIKKLPSTIINLKNLKILILDDTGIKKLPSFIGKMHSLEYLGINSFKMIDIPKGVLELHKLKRIEVGNIENINHIPALKMKCLELNTKEALNRIKRCKNKNTKKLDLSFLYLEKLPVELLELNWIEELDISCNNLKKLPEWIGNFKKLKVFNLNSNKLSSLPDSIGEMKRLKEIILSYNRLKTLPESFGNLSLLEEFYLLETDNRPDSKESSYFKKLPVSFGSLTSLKIFEIWYTKLRMLPKSFGSLKSLIKLTIQTDAILPDNFYPDTMKNLKSITEININGFNKVPDFIAELKNLTSLDISHNKLVKLPDFIGKLTKLKTLNLHSTWITDIPGWIVNLKNIDNLDISSNEISSIDHELPKKMPKLKKLFEWYLKEIEEFKAQKLIDKCLI